MDLWHYPPQVNNKKKSGVMELWDFPNGTSMHEQNTLAEETRLITKDIVTITKNLDDAYNGNDIKQTLNYLATSDNKNMQLAYNIMKQLVESHLLLEYQLDKANKKIQHQQEIIQQVQPEIEYDDNESDEESESEYEDDEQVYEQDTPVTTNIPFFGSPSAPVNFVPSPESPEEQQQDITSFDQVEANQYDLPSSESEQDEIMYKYQNLMFDHDFSCKPRITRNNSAGGGFATLAPNKQTKIQRRQSRKKLYEETNKQQQQQQDSPSSNSMKKLARVKSNPNVRRFRQKKSYLTRREQWNLEFQSGSPKNDASNRSGQHKSSISLDSTALGQSIRPMLDMNRNIPIVIGSSKAEKK